MKKILCVFLSIVMCASLLTVFASCGKKAVDIDLNQCQVVSADDLSKLATKELNNLRKMVTEKAGISLKVSAESKATEGETAYEILVGKTGRKETEKALKTLKNGNGYTIQVIKNKIVIVGTSDALTYLALQDFENTYFAADKVETTISVASSYTQNDCELLTVLSEGRCEYTVIYSGNWDTVVDTNTTVVPVKDKLDVVDYQYKQISDFMLNFTQSAGIKRVNSQADSRTAKEKEIILGTTDREETRTALSKINENQYIITTVNGKIVATAWNDVGVKLVIEKLTEILNDCIEETDSGKVAIYPAALTYIGSFNSNWPTDFPKPDGIDFYGTCDVEDNHVEYCYTGKNVNAAAFDAYSAKLKEAGYRVYTDNTIEDSRFTTFVNDKYMLHVTYSAYKHADLSKDLDPTIRVVAGKLSALTLPVVDNSSQLKYTKVFTDKNVGADTGALISQMYLSYEESYVFGNSYVTMLEDGSFLLYDGGGNGSSTSNAQQDEATGKYLNYFGQPLQKVDEAARLYSLMRDLMYLVGKTGPIVISAWLMSHDHWDHIQCFSDFCKKYTTNVTVENAYANFASTLETFNANNPGGWRTSGLTTALSQVNGNGKYIKVHSGQVFWVRNAEIEVLYTHEDQFPGVIGYFNDTSTVYRIKYHVTDGQGNITDGENGPTTAMWLGDLWRNGSDIVSSMYGSYLKSDMVQVAHHGYNGSEQALYKCISPSLVWWPVSGNQFIYQAYLRTGGGYDAEVDRYIAHKLPSVKWILVAGGISSADANGYVKEQMSAVDENGRYVYESYRHNYTVKVTKNGFDGDKLYYADEGFVGVGGDPFTGSAPVNKVVPSN